jgi:hypothetical protein
VRDGGATSTDSIKLFLRPPDKSIIGRMSQLPPPKPLLQGSPTQLSDGHGYSINESSEVGYPTGEYKSIFIGSNVIDKGVGHVSELATRVCHTNHLIIVLSLLYLDNLV